MMKMMDEKDYTIYNILSQDGRAKLVDIAKAVGLSHPSAKDRMMRLLNNGDITIKARLNLKKKKWQTAVCNMAVENLGEAYKLVEAFKKCPRVIYLQTMTGSYNLILIAVAPNIKILKYFIETEIRSNNSIKKLDISFGEAPEIPSSFAINLQKEPLGEPPCGVNTCSRCYLYESHCDGCPSSKYWKKKTNLIFISEEETFK